MNLFFSLILPLLAFFSGAGTTDTPEKEETVIWIGIDYSAAKFVGLAGFPEPGDLSKYLLAWNDFVITEPDKYDVKKALGVPAVKIDLSYTYAKNEGLDTESMVQEEDYKLSREEVEAVAKSYDLSTLSGTVVMLVAECYNKKTLKGSHWLVMMNADNSEILSAERFVEKPRGFGLRNFWARTIYELLETKRKNK